MIESKTGQRLAGLVLLATGVGFTAWSWHTALNEGYYYEKVAALFPFLAVGGFGMLLFPLDMARVRAEHGVDRPQTLAHYPPVWKALFVVGLLAGLGNWFAISRW